MANNAEFITYSKDWLDNPDRLLNLFETSPFGPPKQPGVYMVCKRSFLYDDIDRNFKYYTQEQIVYIGSAKNIFKRVNNDVHPYIMAFNSCSDDDLVYTKSIVCKNYEDVEKCLINYIQPIINIQNKG